MNMEEEAVVETITDPVVALRDEMNAQFNELKTSFEASLKEKEELIAQLKEQNTSLQRALVRSAVMDPPKVEEPKTEEEMYQEQVDNLAKKTLDIMKARL